MGILQGLIATIRRWDHASKIALATALILLVLDIAVLTTRPDLRTPASIGFVGLMIAIQAIMLWGNRLLVTPYTQAQRHFLAGEFKQAVDVLQAHINELAQSDQSPDVDVWVLLGNTYRNLGQLEESQTALSTALAKSPMYHFALYGMGKTSLALGDYAAAITYIERALEQGAPPIVRLDLAHARWRLGETEAIPTLLHDLDFSAESFRALWAHYLLYRMDEQGAPSAELIAAGLPFWEAELERTRTTPYGTALQQDVIELRQLVLKG